MFTRRALKTLTLLLVLALCTCAWAEESSDWLDGDYASLRQAQQRLIDLGFLHGRADGAYGPQTEAALRDYQQQAGLDASGHLDRATLDALTHVDPASATAKDVQQRLIDLGYLDGYADGIIGPRSTDAMKLFQRLNNLSVNGKADRATLETLFSSDALALPPSLSSGSKGDEVERLQRRLALYAFYDGEIDAQYAQATVSAVRAFQNHLIEQGYADGIAADGVATPLTQYCLYSDQYSTYLRDVTPGVSDSEAQRIERRLNQLGYMDMTPDDVLDDYAIEAMKLFQGQCMMQKDGLADRETFDALFSIEAPPAEHCAPHDIASGDSGQMVRNVESALLASGISTRIPRGKYDAGLESAIDSARKYLESRNSPSASLFSDPKALSVEAIKALESGLFGFVTDDTDDSVEMHRVQHRLYTLYYLPKIGIDGMFGRESRKALKAFQAANGLPETGSPDEATQTLLFSESAEAKPFPYRIEVSLDRQVVEVYQRNMLGAYDLVQTFTCSTGLHDSTPHGIFLDGHPLNRWHYFKKFYCWAQYSFEIEGDILFHSVIYSSDNEHSLRSGSLYALGNPASHGCVRLQVADAKWLFEHCKRGENVIIIG